MLTHVAQTALVEIPITAEGTVAAVRVIRDERRRAAVHVPVKMRGNRLGLKIRLTGPKIHLPSDTADGRETDGQWAAEDTTGDDALDLASRADAIVVRTVETEPGVHAEGDAGLLDNAAQGDAFANRACQGLLTPDGLTATGGHGRDDAVPVRWRTDVDNVGIREGDDFTEIFSHHRRTASGQLNTLELLLHPLGVDIADPDDAVLAGHAGLGVHRRDAAATNDDVIQRLARRNEAAAKHVTRDDREAKGGDSSLTQERTTG